MTKHPNMKIGSPPNACVLLRPTHDHLRWNVSCRLAGWIDGLPLAGRWAHFTFDFYEDALAEFHAHCHELFPGYQAMIDAGLDVIEIDKVVAVTYAMDGGVE